MIKYLVLFGSATFFFALLSLAGRGLYLLVMYTPFASYLIIFTVASLLGAALTLIEFLGRRF